MEDRIRTLERRIRDLEMVVNHLCCDAYAPSNPATALSMQAVRQHCSAALRSARLDAIPAQTAGQGPAELDLAGQVFAAAATARRAAARVESLRSEGASDDAILDAQIAAEEAQTRAKELSEQVRAELCDDSDDNDSGDVFNIGRKPGIGAYVCTTCDWTVRLDEDSDRLPPCGTCGPGQSTQYRRV